jgi:(1->4)-alpha-D-glucan 1-alpha-D-glucosylmutase
VKLFVTAQGLRARATVRDLYERGAYEPLTASGPHRESVFAFARVAGGRAALTIVPRLVSSLVPDASPPIGRRVWGDTRIALTGIPGSRFRDAFTGAGVDAEASDGAACLAVGDVLSQFPVAVLLPD